MNQDHQLSYARPVALRPWSKRSIASFVLGILAGPNFVVVMLLAMRISGRGVMSGDVGSELIFAVVLSFLIPIVLGAMGVWECGLEGKRFRGSGFAVAGILLPGVWLIVGMVIFLMSLRD